MSYFRKLTQNINAILDLLTKDEKWLILIVADPDAMASAMALRRIMARRVAAVDIAHVNPVTRPDNLTMVRYLRIPTVRFKPEMLEEYQRFAVVDSQPHHHPAFKDIPFSIVLDHHPEVEDEPVTAEFCEIRSKYGANSTLLTEYLYNLDIRPGKFLATALLYGIKSDTNSFVRDFCDVDVRAFRYLTKYADHALLTKIARSEFRLDWLEYFSKAFRRIRHLNHGLTVHMGRVDSPDILVILADFFMRVHEVTWTAISGVSDGKLIIIFRSAGTRNMGEYADHLFGEDGSAGGHRTMARAEIPVEALKGERPEDYLARHLGHPTKTPPRCLIKQDDVKEI